MSSTQAAQDFLELTKVNGPVSVADVEKAYNNLGPVSIDGLIGQWKGGSLDTGHPGHAHLLAMKWAGKDFFSSEDVHPIMVYDKDGKRVYGEELSKGPARLREVKFRGVVSASMIYDNQPVIDHFRYVDDKTVVGAMDTRVLPEAGTYYFYLTKL